MRLYPELSFTCGDGCTYGILTNSFDYLYCLSNTCLDTGMVKSILGRLWQVSQCKRNPAGGWTGPKWYVEWEPVDKDYTKALLIGDILAATHKWYLS